MTPQPSVSPQCIVRSYLQWLQDSDYSPQCPLCEAPLGERETVRLICYGGGAPGGGGGLNCLWGCREGGK